MKLSSIHVKSLAINASNISTTTINGQEHYVIRGAVPIVDDIVMNGGLYPAEEINNSYQTMERKLMPIGHPMVNGKYVSANDPQAVNDYYAGAWAQNVSKANDKVVMDVYVNKAVADTKPDGKRLIQRLDDMISGNNADPIHVSTGLLLNKEQKAGESKQKKYSWVAHNMQFDHIAILLDEPFAGVDPIAVEDIQSIVATLKHKNIGVIITDHNVDETLAITDRTYLLYEGKILKTGTAEELAADPMVRKVYLGQHFELKKSHQLTQQMKNRKGQQAQQAGEETETQE